jgi:ATP-binding cassette subfamily F protein uup
VYDAADVTVEVGGRVLFDDLTWQVGPGDRIGIVGANGSGKTTLLRVLTGALAPTAGTVKRGVTVRAAYLSQDVVELAPTLRVLEAVQQVRHVLDLGKGRTITATQLCERFGFVGNAQWTPVGELSGGERRRLQLLRLLMDEPNVLVLDEPTNDLDIDTLTALEDLLDGWPGTLLVVSHDRYFVERVCDREVALLGDGRLRDLPGGVEQYLKLRRAQPAQGLAAQTTTTAGGGGDVPQSNAQTDAAATRTARKELTRLERTLEKLRDREVRLHSDLEAAATDHERVLALDARLRELHEERATLEHRWLELAERLG